MTKAVYLSPQELSERWGGKISTKTLANWRSDSDARGPRYKRFGNRILYSLDDVVAWEDRQNHESTAEYSTRDRGAGDSQMKATGRRLNKTSALKQAMAAAAAEMREMEAAIDALTERRDALALEHEQRFARFCEAGGRN